MDLETDTIGLVDNRGIEYLQLTEEFQFEDFGVYIKIKDFVDEAARERLLAIAQAAMQNQMIDMRDYIRIETAKTYTELLKELEYAMDKKDRERKQEAQRAQMNSASPQVICLAARLRVLVSVVALLKKRLLKSG